MGLEEKKARERKLPYRIRCPGCGKMVLKKELLKRGCYVCGWQGAKNEAELLEIMPKWRRPKEERAPGFGLLDLLLPLITLPLKTPIWLGKTFKDAAVKELYDESKVKEELLRLQMSLDIGEITDEEYDEKEAELLERLEAIKRYKEEG